MAAWQRMKHDKGSLGMNLKLAKVLGIVGLMGVALFSPGREETAEANRREVKPAANEQSRRVKFKKNTKVDFDDALIEGGVKNPFSTMIGGRDGEFNQGFIKIRREWHDQMIMSIHGLNQ